MRSCLRYVLLFFLIIAETLLPFSGIAAAGPGSPMPDKNTTLREFLDKVYKTMDDHYYAPVSGAVYADFLKNYPAEKLEMLNNKTKQTENFIHLGAGLLVNKLKDPADRFTNFIPPKKTKEFKDHAYAVTEDLGIEGLRSPKGFEITRVEKHSEAFSKGVRKGDVILSINGDPVKNMDEASIKKKLSPEVGTITRLDIFFTAEGRSKIVELESKSYFRETVFVLPKNIPGTLVLQISHFNQKTSPDFEDEMKLYGVKNIDHLVIDLRNNEGGPPLAAREILGYFLNPNDHLFAIVKKRQKPFMMAAPHRPVVYRGPISIVVNKKTGSASEMFSGILQAKGHAKLIGQTTAGGCYLKGIFDLEDRSAIFMITSLTYFYDRRVFPADGIKPDVPLSEDQDALEAALSLIAR